MVHQPPPYQEGQHLLDRQVHLQVREDPYLLELLPLRQVPVVQDDLSHLVNQQAPVDQDVQAFHLDQLHPIFSYITNYIIIEGL